MNPVNTWESGVKNGVSLDVIMSTERAFLRGVRKLYITALQQSEGLTDASKQGIIENSFAGVNALNADMSKLHEAEALLQRGIVREEVFEKTGWFLGDDGKWRFEIDDSMDYLYDAAATAYKALPRVLKRGIEITDRKNHKGRGYGTATIAAPVLINGKRANMAVVVMRTSENFYKVHRNLSPDGGRLQFSVKENAEPTPGGGVTENGSLATPISSAFDTSIAETGQNVNFKNLLSPVENHPQQDKSPKKLQLPYYAEGAIKRNDDIQQNNGQVKVSSGNDFRLFLEKASSMEGKERESEGSLVLKGGEVKNLLSPVDNRPQQDSQYYTGKNLSSDASV